MSASEELSPAPPPGARRFPIRFDRAYGWLSSAIGLRPAESWVEVDGTAVEVRMAWGFRARFPRAAVRGARPYARRPFSRGVHGWGGEWLVNGSADGLVEIELAPPQPARVVGFPVRLETLLVSVEDPDGLRGALRAGVPG